MLEKDPFCQHRCFVLAYSSCTATSHPLLELIKYVQKSEPIRSVCPCLRRFNKMITELRCWSIDGIQVRCLQLTLSSTVTDFRDNLSGIYKWYVFASLWMHHLLRCSDWLQCEPIAHRDSLKSNWCRLLIEEALLFAFRLYISIRLVLCFWAA